MSSSQQDEVHVSLDEKFSTSILIGVVIVTLIIIVVTSIIMNIWMRYRSIQVMTSLRNSSYIKNKSVPQATASLKMLTKPLPAFNKETTLPVYRKSDTWENYLKMIQTPGKLNEVVHSMKVSHTPSSSISTKVDHTPSDSIDNNAYYISTEVSHSPSGSIDNTYKVGHTPSGSIDNTCYTFNDYKLHRQTSLPKEY